MKVSPKEMVQLISCWQRCEFEKIADLFNAFNNRTLINQRAVSFKLLEEDIQAIRNLDGLENLIIYLGAREAQTNHADDQPLFQLILQVKTSEQGRFDNCFLMQYDPDPMYLDSNGNLNDNGLDQISAESAFLFIVKWLETEHAELPGLFSSLTANAVNRVKSYTFDQQKSKLIVQDLSNLKSDLLVHMGVGIRVRNHPICFRPIIEVKPQNTKLSNNENGDYYDFSNPCPPICGGD